MGTKQVWTPVENETSVVVAILTSFRTLLCKSVVVAILKSFSKSVRTRRIASADVSCTHTAGLTVALLSKPACGLNL